ncbi:MAG: QueT transporter family protein [Erysipelotrichaceae bacterium]|nr:QueT transporter family protein [Erysipelotrichaceae bacterium]MDD3924403.1 QueT transporter family protein [Erysipelotrichaceae bacterium]
MKTNQNINTPLKKLILISLIAAIYTIMSLLGATYSFSNIQLRFAEILCLLPIFMPISIWGVTLGCFITNLLGAVLGINPIGFIDMIFGTLATLIAAYLTYRTRNVRFKGWPITAALMPVIINGLIIGLELTYVFGNGDFSLFYIFALQVAIGEFIVCVVLGLPIIKRLEQHKLFSQL